MSLWNVVHSNKVEFEEMNSHCIRQDDISLDKYVFYTKVIVRMVLHKIYPHPFLHTATYKLFYDRSIVFQVLKLDKEDMDQDDIPMRNCGDN